MAGKYRTVREEDEFKTAKKKLRRSTKRLDEILDGVFWVLCRKPESFHNIPGRMLYVAKTDPVPGGIPGFYIWYTLDDEMVFLLGIEETPQSS